MKKLLGVAAAAIAFISAPSAFAQSFTSGAGTYTYSGSGVLVQKGNGPVLSCFLSIDITNDGAGNYTADNPVLTGSAGFCDTVVFQNTPWPVTVSGTTVTFSSIDVDTTITPGDCAGYISATFSSPDDLTIDSFPPNSPTLLEKTPGTGHCKLSGVISH